MKLPISGGELSPQNMVRVKGKGVQKTHRPAKPDPTQPAGLGRFLGLGGLGWITKKFFIVGRVGFGS